MQPVHLYTEKYFFWSKTKFLFKKILGLSWRGPQAVEQSLIKGLAELDVPFDVNRKPKSFETIGVLSGIKTLRQAILWKKKGIIKRIIAGPNLVVTPNDFDNIIQDPLIDIVVQPSQWSIDFYKSVAPSLGPKMRVWPAGVELPSLSINDRTTDFLLYNKIGQQKIYSEIVEYLEQNKFSYQTLNYGQFRQHEYFSALEKCKALIYLSESESQGLAMFEAWARGVPAMVWDRGFWQYGNYSWQGHTASPYVTEENGMIFKDFKEFKYVLPKFLQTIFRSREFVEQSFTWKKSAEKYLEIYRRI